VLGGVAAGFVVAQLGVAGAADPTPAPAAPMMQPPGPFMGEFGGPLGFGIGGRVLHSEATVKTADGVQDVATQTGKITALDGATVTVKSSDDFVRDYIVDEDTRITLDGSDGALSSLKTGDSVQGVAAKDGGSWHAKMVLDGLPSRPMLHERFEYGLRHHGGRMAPEPEPSATTTG
jgi:hypothetical protein